jgi:hypothetical protein
LSWFTNSTYALIENNIIFTDAAGKWYETTVNEMGSRKIINGRQKGIFNGNANITRAEFATILATSLGLPAEGTSKFSDVSASSWYSDDIATASRYGLVMGNEYNQFNQFNPNDNITREEAMVMLKRAAKLADYAGTTASLDSFIDADSVSAWAQDAAKWNIGSGLIIGSNGQIHPNNHISRAESATIILRLLQKSELIDVRLDI